MEKTFGMENSKIVTFPKRKPFDQEFKKFREENPTERNSPAKIVKYLGTSYSLLGYVLYD